MASRVGRGDGVQGVSEETLTQALASLGYSHRHPTGEDRAKYGPWVLGQTIVNPSGETVGLLDHECGWALVHKIRSEKSSQFAMELT